MTIKGHSVYLLDRKSGNSTESRALAISSRSLELMAVDGLLAPLISEILPIHGMQFFSNGNFLGQANAGGDTEFPHYSLIPQFGTEHIIENQFNKKGGKVHWNTQLVSYVQHSTGVEVVLQTEGEPDTFTVKSSYLVGADGVRSAVRQSTKDWPYDGVPIKKRFTMADVVLTGKDVDSRLMNHLNVFFHHDGPMMIIPYKPFGAESHVKLFRVLREGEDVKVNSSEIMHGFENGSTENILELFKKAITQRVGSLDIQMGEAVWTSNFRISERIVDTYRRGRVFLAGDAAHCHSPAGGQGMNLGLQDAKDLAWKLSLVLSGHSRDPEMLLDSYTLERKPIAEMIMKNASRGFSIAFSDSWIIKTIRNMVIRFMLSFTSIPGSTVQNIQQIYLRIKDSPLHGVSTPGLITVGEFMKNTSPLCRRTVKDTVVSKPLHSILEGNSKFVVLWISTCPIACKPNDLANDFLKKVSNYPNVCPLVVTSAWNTPVEPHRSSESDDIWWKEGSLEDRCITKRVGLDSLIKKTAGVAMIVLRPDLYVAQSMLINTIEDMEKGFNYLNNILNISIQ
ncbi:FAD binding domain-containing protein [Spinellus fusiger]|nr:FAD binding domain-containing protein [Spinellus fusiger]